MNSRLLREQKTISNMITIFCNQRHKCSEGLCHDCGTLLEYSLERLQKCFLGTRKPICSRCTVHCYKQDMRNQIKLVMRYSGKRMLLLHPVLTIQHLMDFTN